MAVNATEREQVLSNPLFPALEQVKHTADQDILVWSMGLGFHNHNLLENLEVAQPRASHVGSSIPAAAEANGHDAVSGRAHQLGHCRFSSAVMRRLTTSSRTSASRASSGAT